MIIVALLCTNINAAARPLFYLFFLGIRKIAVQELVIDSSTFSNELIKRIVFVWNERDLV